MIFAHHDLDLYEIETEELEQDCRDLRENLRYYIDEFRIIPESFHPSDDY